jgi:nicotinamidase-related amidase
MQFKIDPTRFGVLIIDMQESFLKDISSVDKIRLINTQNNLINLCAIRDYPITILEYEGEGKTIIELINSIRLVPRYSFLKKLHDNAFLDNPDLQAKLKFWNLETLCLTGINAECCILDTAVGAIEQGYNLLTSRDLLASEKGIKGVLWAEKGFAEKSSQKNYFGTIKSYLCYEDLIKNL